MNKEVVKNEIEIGEKIKKIKNHENFFAPIVDDCSVNLNTLMNSKLTSAPISKCDVIEKSKDNKFNLNKIRYIKGKDLEDTFQNILNTNQRNPEKTLEFLIDTQCYLSKSIQKMSKKSIVHYDLKSNNIIFDTELEVPIIIDFGLSMQTEQINAKNESQRELEKLNKMLFDTFEYDYWCMDAIICGIYSHIKTSEPPQPKEYLKSLTGYVNYATFFKPKFQKSITRKFNPQSPIQKTIAEFNDKFTEKWTNFISENKTLSAHQIFEKLWESRFTWDIYSLSVIYILFISDMPPYNPNNRNNTEFEKYAQYNLDILLSLPEERTAKFINQIEYF